MQDDTKPRPCIFPLTSPPASLFSLISPKKQITSEVGPNICHHEIGPMVIQDFTEAKLAILA